MAFSDDEIAYLQSQPIARLATVNADGQPDVVPVAFELDGSYIWVGGVGPDVARTRKLRNIGAGRSKVTLVFDDLVSMEPFIARALAAAEKAGGLQRRSGRRTRSGAFGRGRAASIAAGRSPRPKATRRGRPRAAPANRCSISWRMPTGATTAPRR